MPFCLINTHFQLSLLLDKFSLGVTYFDIKRSFPGMHLTLHVFNEAEVFCRKLQIDSVMIPMNMPCLHQKEISYSQKEAVWEKKRWMGKGEGEAWSKREE